MATNDWSNLPSNILGLVLQRLEITDCIRLGSVCSSWHSMLAENLSSLPTQAPWLMLPGDNNSDTRNFYCLPDGNTLKIHLPEIRKKPCVGSGDGWLVYVDHDQELRVLNPLTRAQFTLPPITTLDNEGNARALLRCISRYLCCHSRYPPCPYDMEETSHFLLNKVIISTDPATATCTAVTTHSFMQLAVAKLGDDESWTMLDTPFECFHDVIVHERRLYVVNWSGRVATCDLSNYPCSPKPKVVELPPSVPNRTMGRYYLVELSGDILLIWRDDSFNAMDSFIQMRPVYRAGLFKVLKLDQLSNEWVGVNTLGDYSLFLGRNHSMAFSGLDFPGLGKNCIYEHRDRQLNLQEERHDYGVYRLEDGCYQNYYVSDLWLHWQPPIWIVPKVF